MGNQVGQMIGEHSLGDQVASGGPGCVWYVLMRRAHVVQSYCISVQDV